MGYGTTVSLTISDCASDYDTLVSIAGTYCSRLKTVDENGTGLEGDERIQHICKYCAKQEALFTLERIFNKELPVFDGTYADAGIAFTTQFKNLNSASYVELIGEYLFEVLKDEELKFVDAYLIIEEEQDEWKTVYHYTLDYDADPAMTRNVIRPPRSGSWHQLDLTYKDIDILLKFAVIGRDAVERLPNMTGALKGFDDALLRVMGNCQDKAIIDLADSIRSGKKTT